MEQAAVITNGGSKNVRHVNSEQSTKPKRIWKYVKEQNVIVVVALNCTGYAGPW